MNHSNIEEPLTDAEFDRLDAFLADCDGLAMNVEEMDGFLTALIVGPDLVLPSEYLPEIFDLENPDDSPFANADEANFILRLLMRHWNTIAREFREEDVHIPIINEDENGDCLGNDWAYGFMHGLRMRSESWKVVIDDEERFSWLLPVMMLYHEHDEDPELRPDPIPPEKRERIVITMAAGLIAIYKFFRDRRSQAETDSPVEPVRGDAKIGRNEWCPCGSGKKYKRCCGGAVIQ